MHSWKSGKRSHYKTYTNRRVQFSFKIQADTVQPPLSVVLDFLHILKNSGVGYSGLNTALSLFRLLQQ